MTDPRTAMTAVIEANIDQLLHGSPLIAALAGQRMAAAATDQLRWAFLAGWIAGVAARDILSTHARELRDQDALIVPGDLSNVPPARAFALRLVALTANGDGVTAGMIVNAEMRKPVDEHTALHLTECLAQLGAIARHCHSTVCEHRS